MRNIESQLISVTHAQLKCSGEPNGCQRCLAKKIECHFPAPAKSSGTSLQKKGSLPSPSEPPISQVNRISDALESPLDDDNSIVASTHETLEDNGSFDFELSNFDPLEDADALLFTSELSPSETWQQPSIFPMNTDETTLPRNDMSWVGGDMGPCLSGGTSTWESSEKRPAATIPNSENTEFCFTCLAKAMKTHEAIEAASWALREKVDYINEMLQEQKKAMVECKELLGFHEIPRKNLSPYDKIPSADPRTVQFVKQLCSKIKNLYPGYVTDFEKRYEAWQNTWCTGANRFSSNPDITISPEFQDLANLGPKSIPLVVEKLAQPKDFFATSLYIKIEKDSKLKVGRKKLLDYCKLQCHANLVVDTNYNNVEEALKQFKASMQQKYYNLDTNLTNCTDDDAYKRLTELGEGAIAHIMMEWKTGSEDQANRIWEILIYNIIVT
ncbi:hypothetical protein diail_8102, partial [Diaporthe ilicicola]